MTTPRPIILSAGLLLIMLSASACQRQREQREPTPNEPAANEPAANEPTPPAAEEAAPGTGEVSSFDVEDGVVVVHNELCGVSRTQMGPETIGQFVSQVEYQGDDPRFVGKTFTFNQCCNGCLARFPAMFAADPDEILAFHGITTTETE